MADTEQGAPAGALTPGEIAELGALKAEMGGHDTGGHWSEGYWCNQTKQLRARELMAREAGLVERSAGADHESENAAADGPAALGRVMGRDLDRAFGPSASEINNAIAGLPDGLRAAMAAELSDVVTSRPPNASHANLQAFERTGAGAILLKRWGNDAPRRLGLALYRVARFEADLSEADHRQWQSFWHGMQPHERAAVLDRLTA